MLPDLAQQGRPRHVHPPHTQLSKRVFDAPPREGAAEGSAPDARDVFSQPPAEAEAEDPLLATAEAAAAAAPAPPVRGAEAGEAGAEAGEAGAETRSSVKYAALTLLVLQNTFLGVCVCVCVLFLLVPASASCLSHRNSRNHVSTLPLSLSPSLPLSPSPSLQWCLCTTAVSSQAPCTHLPLQWLRWKYSSSSPA
jgi:hypothetical protein